MYKYYLDFNMLKNDPFYALEAEIKKVYKSEIQKEWLYSDIFLKFQTRDKLINAFDKLKQARPISVYIEKNIKYENSIMLRKLFDHLKNIAIQVYKEKNLITVWNIDFSKKA